MESDEGIWVNLFVGGTAQCRVQGATINLATITSYPWDGRITISINPTRALRWSLRLRISGWAKGSAVPSDLYEFKEPTDGEVVVRLNGQTVPIREEKSYAVIERKWRKGDVIELHLPTVIHRVVARSEVQADRGRFALQRGPLVYCIEGADNHSDAWNIVASQEGELTAKPHRVVHESDLCIQGHARAFDSDIDGKNVLEEQRSFTAIPYYAWANRDNLEMQVWLPAAVGNIKING